MPEAPRSTFQFATAATLTRVSPLRAATLAELRDRLRLCSDASLFHHTFQCLGHHHFIKERFSNDFAQWVAMACNRPDLAERISGLDIRDYTKLSDLRAAFRLLADYCRKHVRASIQPALEPFYFLEIVAIPLPLGREASTLQQFRDGLAASNAASFEHHFLASRLRLQLKNNDFSQWLSESLQRNELAQNIARLDIYTNTLQTARAKILVMVEEELQR